MIREESRAVTNAAPIRLVPAPGQTLRDLLFERGVEFPCGGASECGGCKIRVLDGDIPVTPEARAVFSEQEVRAGWRLGCQAETGSPATVVIDQWSVPVLDDRAAVPFEPGEDLGAVVDIGTTTLVAQLVDRGTGDVVAVETALNPQARFGADLMTRIRHELAAPGTMMPMIREAVGRMLARMASGRPVAEVLLVGNTAMHHFFCGLDVAPLATVPFRSPWPGAREFGAREPGWDLDLRGSACFLPCLGGFVGSDLLAGLVATGFAASGDLGALLDLGTNGEIAVGDRSGIRCASTAAGPAFEGGRISMGMRAGVGAIERVWRADERLGCSVLGCGPPRGICGSGLVDAAAVALELGWIDPRGRVLRKGRRIPLAGPVTLSQADIRELQLAKAAIAAGLDLLLDGRRPAPGRIHLAGAFGNYVRAASARRLGLLPGWAQAPTAAGNTALRGARMLLLAGSRRRAILDAVLACAEHVELASDPQVETAYIEHMCFSRTLNH
jgi:uncharacterized 2Fe-2S/4Fe-4S cluster protein (DUF4445 family)